jgi:hypothetical protein
MRRVDSGSVCSERLVELTMSAKMTLTVLRTSPAVGAAPARGVAQLEQNLARSEFSSPQVGQRMTRCSVRGACQTGDPRLDMLICACIVPHSYITLR